MEAIRFFGIGFEGHRVLSYRPMVFPIKYTHPRTHTHTHTYIHTNVFSRNDTFPIPLRGFESCFIKKIDRIMKKVNFGKNWCPNV